MHNYKYKTEDSVLIRYKWKEDSSRLIQTFNCSNETKLNYITEIVEINIDEEKFGDKLNKGDTIFLSRYFTAYPKFKLNKTYVDNYDYSSIPAKLILGRFKDGMTNLGSLEMSMDKILIEPLEELKIGNIFIPNNQCDIGRIVKIGTHTLFRDYTKGKIPLKIGDTVLYWTNTGTPLILGLKKYSCLELHRIIGKFNRPGIQGTNRPI